jgi:AraC-type DNA-binding domain-containing proteins
MKDAFQANVEIRDSGDFFMHSVLILNDNQAIFNSVYRLLKKDFNVSVIDRVSPAFKQISNNCAELLVICASNPGVDILVLCQAIAKNIFNSYVGIIVITDSDSIEIQTKFYEAGADIVLSFPVDEKLIDTILKNQIRKGQHIKNGSDNALIQNSFYEYQTSEYEWIARLTGVVELNLKNSSFGLDEFASAMGSSKSTLYRRIKKIADISPVEFIRNTRLIFASRLLSNTTDNICYIAYEVGFNDAKHFTSAFRSYFGISPNVYRRKVRQNW